MRKFIMSTMLFFAISIMIYLGILIVFNIFLEKEIYETNTLRPNTRVLAMGDSHLECSINDIAYDVFENRSRMSERYYQVYFKLKYILENDNNKDKINAICLTYNKFSLLPSQDSLYSGISPNHHFIRNYTPLFRDYNNRPQVYNLPMDSKSYWRSFASSFMISITDIKDYVLHRKVRNLFEYHGSFINEDKKYGKQFTPLTKTSMNLREVELSNIQQDHLTHIAKLAYANNIQLVLINAPCHEYYNAANDPKLIYANRQFASKLHNDLGVIYLDFSDTHIPDECFRDYEHLNLAGANIFTPMLRDTLISLGLY